MASAHTAVKHELLVRYLDAWLPAAMHGHKRVTYVDAGVSPDSAVAAARVFAEFPDLLARHPLTMVLTGPAPSATPAGLLVRAADGPLVAVLSELTGAPMFVWGDASSPQASAKLWAMIAASPGGELMLTLPPGASTLDQVRAAGLPLHAQVELVDASGAVEVLAFATASEKALQRFKDELWALDEYAGIRYRDPGDPEHTLLDIKLQPNLRPLRRALTAHLAEAGTETLTGLRDWTQHETIYRPQDATRAIQALIQSGELTRSPTAGRLSPTALIMKS
jgi:hypothetical protein